MSPLEVQFESRNGTPREGSFWSCPTCEAETERSEWRAALSVCPHCGYHARVGARERVAQVADRGSFTEEWSRLRPLDPLKFVDLEAYPTRVRTTPGRLPN